MWIKVKLVIYELKKIWGRPRFLLFLCAFMALHVFLLWYQNLPDEQTPPLSAYGRFQEMTAGMNEEEKGAYICRRKEILDGVSFVEEVLLFQGVSGQMGQELADRAMAEHPGLFQEYDEWYLSGAYLEWTDSLWRERTMVEEVYGEWQQVSTYGDYLASIQEKKDTLGGIGIFAGSGDSFSARNIRKSARDYAHLTASGIRFTLGRTLTGALEHMWTDLVLLLGVFLSVGEMILAEKEKGLFLVTRVTKHGLTGSIAGKLAALLIHCILLTGSLYAVNFLFFGCQAGFPDGSARLQSVAAFRESPFAIRIWEYVMLSVLTKAVVLYGFGVLLTIPCLLADSLVLPYSLGMLFCGINGILYLAVPASSRALPLKTLNLAGLLQTKRLYGAYLNFDLLGYPFSRVVAAWLVILLFVLLSVGGSIFCFVRGQRLVLRKGHLWVWRPPFKPHGSLLRHECHKIMVGNRGGVILLCCMVLVGSFELGRACYLSAGEQYYRDIMLRLEGGLTKEKEDLVLAEKSRYEKAFQQVERIERLMAEGVLSEPAGEEQMAKWKGILAFYPDFRRVWQQYEGIREHGEGHFIYDTGYLYLFGIWGGENLVDLLLVVLGVILVTGNGNGPDTTCGIWKLLGATRAGKRRILMSRLRVCVSTALLLALVPVLCRAVGMRDLFTWQGFGLSTGDIPCCSMLPGFLTALPVVGFVLVFALSQGLVLAVAALLVFALSLWQRTGARTYFLAMLVFILPLVLQLLGLSWAERFSLYPLYSWMRSM